MHALKEPNAPLWKHKMKEEAVSLCINAAKELYEYSHIISYLSNPPLEAAI